MIDPAFAKNILARSAVIAGARSSADGIENEMLRSLSLRVTPEVVEATGEWSRIMTERLVGSAKTNNEMVLAIITTHASLLRELLASSLDLALCTAEEIKEAPVVTIGTFDVYVGAMDVFIETASIEAHKSPCKAHSDIRTVMNNNEQLVSFLELMKVVHTPSGVRVLLGPLKNAFSNSVADMIKAQEGQPKPFDTIEKSIYFSETIMNCSIVVFTILAHFMQKNLCEEEVRFYTIVLQGTLAEVYKDYKLKLNKGIPINSDFFYSGMM